MLISGRDILFVAEKVREWSHRKNTLWLYPGQLYAEKDDFLWKRYNALRQKQVRLEQRLNGYIVEKNGLRTLLNCVDNFGGEKFWQQQSPCDALAALILKVTSRQSRSVMAELRLLVLSQNEPEHYGFLLSSIIEKSKKSRNYQKAVSAQILDRIFFPADVLWVREFGDEEWVQHFVNSLFLAQSWLAPTRAGYCSEYNHRIKKLLAILIYINGCRDEKNIVSLILHLLDGSEKNEEKARLLLETFSLLHRARNLPDVSNEEDVDHFGIISLNSKPGPEIINEIFFNSLAKLMGKLEKSRGIMANLLVKTMVLWNEGFDEESFVRDLQEVDINGEESYTWSVLHLMGLLGEWLMDKDDSFEDEDVILALLGVVKENFRRVDQQIIEFSLKQKGLDIRLLFNAPDLLRTTHLSLGLLGGLYGQGESEKVHGLYEECGDILLKLHNTLSVNESIIDEDYRNLKLNISNFLKLLGKDLIKTSSDKLTASDSDYDRLMQIMQNGFEDEEDGSVEIAERGGAVIKMTGLIRRRDSCLVDDCPRLFNVLFYNIHHPDSYVYLSAINSLSHLVLWKHSEFLGKMIFLFLNWECSCEDNDSKNCDICNRNQIQLGEAISRILLELGEISVVYYGQLNTVFTAMLNHHSDIVVSSSLSAFSNLIQVSKGKFLWKNFFELLYICNELLLSKRDKLLRRASVFLLRTMLSAQETSSLLRSNKEANTKLIQVLKQTRATDSDDVVRFHADLALSDVKEVLKQQMLTDSIEKNTRVLYL
uniref:CHAT domain-containing protein n=1 Tax=Bursaphelenchus xylophilus TaxID=6326 RepID=A0A1I7S7H1_BURXY